MAQPLIPDRWKYIIAHDRGGNFDGTGKRAYHTEVGPRGQVWARDPNQQAPHAYNANREAFGVSATGQVGQMPGQQQLTSLKKYYEGSQAQDRERFGKGREWIGHGHAYERSKGQRNQASKDGRSTNEAAWLGAVTSNGSGTPGNPVQPWHNASGMEGMIDGGELSAANWTGAKGAAANPPLASPPRTLVASHTAGAAGIPSVSGPTPIQEHPQMERKRQGGFGNFANQLLNPMTMAGLSILSDGNVGKGFSQLQNARQQQSLMDFRNQEAERAQGNSDRSFSATASHRTAMQAFQEQQAKIRQGNLNRSFGLQEQQAKIRQGNSDRSFKLQERRFGQQKAVNKSAMEGVVNKRFGGVAQMIQSEQHPAKKFAMWQQMLAANPGIAQIIPDEMRGDPIRGSQYAMALARGYVDPMQQKLNQAKIDAAKAKRLSAGSTSQDKQFTKEQKLRKEYIKQTSDFQDVSMNYSKVMNTNSTGPGDMSMIFAYMKMLDPGSAVREGEYANAEKATGLMQQLMMSYNKAIDGEFLSPIARSQFQKQATRSFKAYEKRNKNSRTRYENLARTYGIPVANIVSPQTAPDKAKTNPYEKTSTADLMKRREELMRNGQ